MQNLFKFLFKYHFFILFIFLELGCVYLIVQNNNYQKAKFINSANVITGGAYQTFNSASDFIRLRSENEKLAIENAALRNKLNEVHYKLVPTYLNDTLFVMDTVVLDSQQLYSYLPAKVISNSIYKQYNIIYLDKGLNDGIEIDMGVIDFDGVVGVVTEVSNKFAIVMPIIHREYNMSARIKKSGYFGNLSWDGVDPKYAQLTDIPNHILPLKGDTIITSGFSSIFPENIVVGYVEEYTEEVGSGFLNISVKLASDFGRLNYVYGIEYKMKNDINQLQID